MIGSVFSAKGPWRRVSQRSLWMLGLTLVACATPPRPPLEVATNPQPAPSPGAMALQRRLEASAATQDRQGRLAEEALSIELLGVLNVGDATYASRLEALKSRIATAANLRIQRGAEAFKRGEVDLASGHYLTALALDPANEVAAGALRAIERERNRRLLTAKQTEKRPAAMPPEMGD